MSKKKMSLSKEEELARLNKIGNRLRYFRKKMGYTNSDSFAYENEFSRPQYGKYEAGANIQLNTLMKILRAMNVSLEEFFQGFDEV